MVRFKDGFAMRSMTSREIHSAIHAALGEVSRSLASGELDGSGRYYSDSELSKLFAVSDRRSNQHLIRDSGSPHKSAETA
jgi:hypothetical protein